MSREILQVSGLSMRFGGLLAVNGVGLTVKEKQVVALIGPNGAGKSTLFRLVLGEQRFGELPSGGQVLQYQIRVPFRARRVVPAHFARQYAAFGQVAGVEFAQRRDRAFDPGHGRRVEGHGDEPPLAPPFDFSLGETRRAHQARHAVGFRNGAGVGKHRQRQVGRQQCPGEMLQGHYHLYSVLTLMEPMLSMATSWAAEAL